MCDTPLEIRYMLAGTEARARAFASEVRSEDAAMAGGLARLTRFLGRLSGSLARPLARPFAHLNSGGATKRA
jgi:hypothetical protein